jgi:hypothetical protein
VGGALGGGAGGALVVVAVVAAVFIAGFCKIADLDFWWHAKTGELIVTTRDIPRQDVFSFTAAGREYVDHEWLFQVAAYATLSAFGPAGVAVLKCVVISATLLLVAWFCLRSGADAFVTAGLLLLAIAGGVSRMIERPEIFSTLFAVAIYICCRRGKLIVIPFLFLLWSNIHGAAVIVGLIILALTILGRSLQERRVPKDLTLTLIASIVACGANPFGYRVLSVPFELTRIIDSGVLNNDEWRAPTLQTAPFFFLTLAIAAVMMVRRRADVATIFIALFLAFLALRYVRNIGLFCTFMPMLVAPAAARLRRNWSVAIAALGAAAFAAAASVYYPFERGTGEASYFPDRIARFTRDNNLRGNMLNAYGFGGYLIWSLFPERRVFIDGRNEVYLPLLERIAAARRDSRAWNALLNDYRIEYALIDYTDALDRVVLLDASGKASAAFAPVSVTRFPRSRWALVYWDDDGMVLVRRGGINAALSTREYASVFPEGSGYQQQLIGSGRVDRAQAVAELERRLAEDPTSRRARSLLQSIQNR